MHACLQDENMAGGRQEGMVLACPTGGVRHAASQKRFIHKAGQRRSVIAGYLKRVCVAGHWQCGAFAKVVRRALHASCVHGWHERLLGRKMEASGCGCGGIEVRVGRGSVRFLAGKRERWAQSVARPDSRETKEGMQDEGPWGVL